MLVAVLSMAIATAVELLTGVITDRALGKRLWDYTGERGNILGYVCPRFSLIWGIVCAVVIRLIPRLTPLFDLLRNPLGYAISVSLLVLIIVDEKFSIMKSKAIKNTAFAHNS